MEGFENNIRNIKQNIKVTVIHSKHGIVEEISQLMPHEAWHAFRKTYGYLLDLLYIIVEAPVQSGLTQILKPSLQCFDLPG